jgi:ssDNA-binding Zn-finger/Zn-ribbon topoisomerase 1
MRVGMFPDINNPARDQDRFRKYPMFPSTFREGEWYIAAACPNCKKLIPIFRDLTEGTSKFASNSYQLTCPQCQRKGVFESQRYKASSGELKEVLYRS